MAHRSTPLSLRHLVCVREEKGGGGHFCGAKQADEKFEGAVRHWHRVPRCALSPPPPWRVESFCEGKNAAFQSAAAIRLPPALLECASPVASGLCETGARRFIAFSRAKCPGVACHSAQTTHEMAIGCSDFRKIRKGDSCGW